MNTEPMKPSSSGRDARLEKVLIECVEALEKGRPLDRQELMARYPEFAAELSEFFADRDRLEKLAEPLRAMAPKGTPTTEPGRDAATIGHTETTAANPQLGTNIRYFGDYELLEEIARGGMGVVYKARQVSLNRIVALKMILAGQFASAVDVQRFHTEAEAAANLDHPNIVPIYEVGENDGRHYFSMKLIVQRPTFSRCPKGSGAPRQTASLVAKVARAVHYAHQRGIIHRDLKPANILVDDQDQPHITDFGLAKRTEGDANLSQSGAVVGTPAYMAPEQAAGKKGLTTAADVYSLGAILYELLTGKPPFVGSSALDILLQVMDNEPIPPRQVKPGIDRDLETICLKCLAKDPQRRYGTAAALAEDLERWLAGEPILARPATAWEQVTKWAKRRPAVAALIVVSVLAPIALLAVGLIFNADLQVASKNVNELQVAVSEEKAKADRATNQAEKDAKEASDANLNAQDAKKRAGQLVLEAEGLRLIGESRVALPDNPTLSLLLAIEGAAKGPRLAAHNNALVAAWSACRERGPVLREENSSPLLSAAFFPDGKRVLTTSSQLLCVWDRKSGKLLTKWQAPLQIVSSSISPDGRFIVVTFKDYFLAVYSDGRRILHTDWVARLWEPKTNRETILRGHENRVVTARFSPDSTRVITASWDHTARIWDVASGEQVHVLKGHTNTLASAGYSGDGKTVVTVTSSPLGFSTVPAEAFKQDLTGVDLPVPAGVEISGGHGGNSGGPGSGGGGGKANLARIWDADSGEEQKIVQSPSPSKAGWLSSGQAALSPDGKCLALDVRGIYHLWDLQSDKVTELSKVYDNKLVNYPLPPAFSLDGKFLLTPGSPDGRSVVIWNTATGKEAGFLTGHEEGILSAQFADNHQIITTSTDKTCRVWTYAGAGNLKGDAGREVLVLKGHELEVRSAHLSPDGSTVVTASADGTARFWSVREQEMLGRMLPTPIGGVRSVAVSPKGPMVATGSFDNTLRLWDIKTWQMQAEWKGQTGKQTAARKVPFVQGDFGDIYSLSFSSDGKKLLTVSADAMHYKSDAAGKKTIFPDPFTPVRIWNVETGQQVGLKGGHEAWVRASWFSPDGKRVLTIAEAPKSYAVFPPPSKSPLPPPYVRSEDHTARIWDSANGSELVVLQGNWQHIHTAAWSPDGSRVCTTHEDGVRIWNAADGTVLLQLSQTRGITSALFSLDGSRLITWQDRLLAIFTQHASPRQDGGQADLWNAATGQHLTVFQGHQTPINSAVFSPDGQRVVTTAEAANEASAPNGFLGLARGIDTTFLDRTARIWDAATGKPLMVLRGHLRSVHSASFSKDGRWLVTTSEDRTARIWDLATGKEYLTLTGHKDAVKSAEFTPDGHFVVTTSWDGTARIWPTDPLALALERKPRELTAEERNRFGIEQESN